MSGTTVRLQIHRTDGGRNLFDQAFIAIGHTAIAVGSDMKPFLEDVMSQIRWVTVFLLFFVGLTPVSDRGYKLEGEFKQINLPLSLNSRDRRKNASSEEPIFQCIGMLASALGPNLTKLLQDQLDLMFSCGLSEPLRHALVSIVRQIPPLLKTIQGKSEHSKTDATVKSCF